MKDDTFWATSFPTVSGRTKRSLMARFRAVNNVDEFILSTDSDYSPAIARAIAALPSNGGVVEFDPGTFDFATTLTIPSNVTFRGAACADKIYGKKSATTLRFTGTVGPAAQIKPGAGLYFETNQFEDIEFDGILTTGNIVGILLSGTNGGGAGVRGVTFRNCAVTNFSGYQVHMNENIFHILFDGCMITNRDRASGVDLVRAEGGAVGQITYQNCWLSQGFAGLWCHYGAAHDTRWIAGTVESAAGANGVYVENVGITVLGTHFESYGASATSIGIQYVGVLGGIIAPSNVSIYGTGIRIGNPVSGASPATGVTVAGGYTGNNVRDLHIVAGGSRKGVIVHPSGTASGPTGAIVLNERFTIDGSLEVIRLDQFDSFRVLGAGGLSLPGGNANSVAEPAIEVGNNRLISFNDHNGAKTIGAFLGLDTSDRLLFGAGNSARMWLSALGQIGIGTDTPDPSAIFHLAGTTLGSLPVPRMTKAQRDAIPSPAEGLLVYQLDNTAGLRQFIGGFWVSIVTAPDGTSTLVSGNFSGVVDPEGFQVASPGAHYWDSALKRLFVKDSGTGNTGWREIIS